MTQKEQLRRNLEALFMVFKDKPSMMAEFMVENEILTERTKKLIINNHNLTELSDDIENDKDVNIPFFKNIEDMNSFYNKFFEKSGKKKVVSKNDNSLENLTKQLSDAISAENYEAADKIKKFMDKKFKGGN